MDVEEDGDCQGVYSPLLVMARTHIKVDPIARSASASKSIYKLDPLLALTCGEVAFGCEAEGRKSQIHGVHVWGVSQWTYCKKIIISTLTIWLSLILELKQAISAASGLWDDNWHISLKVPNIKFDFDVRFLT